MTGPELRAATLDEQANFTGNISQYPQVGRPPGDAQERWITYWLFGEMILDDITNGTSIVEPLTLGIYINGVHTDTEAMTWAEKNERPKLLYARGIAEIATSKGRHDITMATNAYWGQAERIYPDPWSDAVFEAIIGAGVVTVGSVAFNVFRAGMTLGWKNLFSGGVKVTAQKVAVGAATSRMAAQGSRQLLPKVTRAMAKNGITEETLIRAAVSGRGIESALRSQLRNTYIRTAWYSTATATVGLPVSIVHNAIFAAENDMADLDAIAIAEADREMEQALEEVEQPQGFLEEAEAVWGSPGRGVSTYPDPTQPPGLQGLVVNGETVTDPRGNPVRVQLTGNESQQEIADALAAAGRTGLQDDDPLIGVPPGGFNAEVSLQDKLYDANRTTGVGVTDDVAAMSDYAIRQADPVFVQADYVFSDRLHILFNMTPGQTEAFQMQAIDAGLINPDTAGFALGSRDQQTIDAMETTMVYANNMGRDWRGAVEQLASEWQGKLRAIENEKERENQRIYSPQPFMALDTAFTAQMVKEDIRKRLGREPNQAELQMLQSYIASEYRTAYEENERVLRADFAAQGRAIEDKTEQDGISGVQVDWGARFAEEFEDRYAAELDRKTRTEQTESKRGDLMASFRLGQNV